MKSSLVLSTVIGLCISLLGQGKADAASFTKIADTSGNFSSFYSFAINNTGTVAFLGNLNTGSQGIFTSNGTSTKTIAQTGDKFSSLSSFSLNDSGTVAFSATLNDGGAVYIPGTEIVIVPGNGIYKSDGVTTTTVAQIPRMGAVRGFRTVLDWPSINNSGTIVYAKIYRFLSTVFSTDGRIIIGRQLPRVEQPLINDAGTIAYVDDSQSIFINNGNKRTLVATSYESNPDSFGIGEISLNNQGTIAYTTLDFGGNGRAGNVLYSTGNGLRTTIADNSGAFNGIFSPAINDQGTIAFIAQLDNGGEGIFTGNDPVKDKVIGIGDSLLGSTVKNIGFSEKGLNNSGQLAFLATLDNGISGIFVTDLKTTKPESVPESSYASGIIFLGALVAASRSKQIFSSFKASQKA